MRNIGIVKRFFLVHTRRMLRRIYLINKTPQSSKAFAIKIKDKPWQSGQLRFILFLRQGAGQADVAPGHKHVGEGLLQRFD